MADKDANSSYKSCKNQYKTDSNLASTKETEEDCSAAKQQTRRTENGIIETGPYLPYVNNSEETSSKKEENPFSFKKFLNQDHSVQTNKGARKKVYSTTSSRNSEMKTREYSTEVSSVLPDFVQDHLVIEQCYLNNSAINIDNLNLQNLPDINVEHQNVQFKSTSVRDINNSNDSFSHFSDNHYFNSGSKNFQLGTQVPTSNEGLPDFTLTSGANVASCLECVYESDSIINNKLRTRSDVNGTNKTSHSLNRQRTPMSSSPSVPLDLPSFDTNHESNSNASIPFDLTISTEEKNCDNRGASVPESVSKSLPDFLSDGPIKKELDNNIKHNRGNGTGMLNGPNFSEPSGLRVEHERLTREIDSLRCKLLERNRRIEILESDIQHLHEADQRETERLKHILKDVEKNLKQTTRRASNAEDMVLKLKQEIKLLKCEVSSLQAENTQLRSGNYDPERIKTQETGNQKIAKELRVAANVAESSLKSLLRGIENLRLIASAMDNSCNMHETDEGYETIAQKDSASGSTL